MNIKKFKNNPPGITLILGKGRRKGTGGQADRREYFFHFLRDFVTS
jgi:hypothetical protein